jgi:hypothetical protein
VKQPFAKPAKRVKITTKNPNPIDTTKNNPFPTVKELDKKEKKE